MKILIVEDNVDRILILLKKMYFGDKFITLCSSAKGAIEALDSQTYDEIWLDHDLDGFNYTNDEACKVSNSCGCSVARHIAKLDSKAKIVIHSQNFYGSNTIKSILPQGWQMPFRPDMI